ncbi:uncharacterized protein GGS22DRAFT_183203 [Annulohypoxylon maeteangense]|uniref:uncharacterized protein n=1 Tax=Annulohypoxylon maeteangense TaxID=1927788 RepID=UPI0020079E77|nr:uncharacterized protein GGS22DRAFT_183203 [Annulohypoxylon maeteangense]KAI0889855.1 hypothetical protein GGS22DRAFT_183203 [Annulohypoxylon maeteangense]
MQFTTLIASTLALVGCAFADDGLPSAILNIESSHGGAGSGLRNATIEVGIGGVYSGNPVLNEVSSIYLVGTTKGAQIEMIVCYGYKSTDGTGSHSTPVTAHSPARLSTNTVVVGSIVCTDGK